jgi:mannose-6-phosphate isomerase
MDVAKMSDSQTQPVVARPYLMHNQVQYYEWGTHDGDAYIAQLLGITPEPGKTYAELWMGAHPKAPSSVVVNGHDIPLDQWIAAHAQELLGQAVAASFANTLPFLFKVLAAGEALSIQAHPTKAEAKLLRASDPAHYPDDNHKPEIAIAIDGLKALMGIKPLAALAETLRRYPEIAGFAGADVSAKPLSAQNAAPDQEQQIAREFLTALFSRAVSHPQALAQAVDALAQRLTSQGQTLSEVEQLFMELCRKYPNTDVGLFAIFVLNLVHLAEGEGIYVAAGVPHAYLKGNIIECMANSDNVIRVGLTSKFKDTPALLQVMRVEPKEVDILRANPSGEETIYHTPAPEFLVSRLRLPAGAQRTQRTGNKPEVFIILTGELTVTWPGGQETYRRGQSVFIPANLAEYTLAAGAATEIFKTAIPN